METHLKLAGRPEAVQHAALAEIIGSNPVLMKVLDELRQGALPDGWVVAGAIYNPVWNRLTGRPDLNGINDVDVFYFDGADLSY